MRITEGTLRSITKKAKEKFLSKSTVLLMIIFSTFAARAQEAIEISGVVTDQERHEPLVGVAVSIKGTVAGTITSSTGVFTLKTKQKLPFTLVFTSVGFAPTEIEVTSLGSKLQV